MEGVEECVERVLFRGGVAWIRPSRGPVHYPAAIGTSSSSHHRTQHDRHSQYTRIPSQALIYMPGRPSLNSPVQTSTRRQRHVAPSTSPTCPSLHTPVGRK